MILLGFDIPLWPALLSIVVILFYIYTVKPLFFFDGCNLDGPTPYPLVGNLMQIIKLGISDYDSKYYKLYKSQGKKAYKGFMGTGFPTITVLDLELLKAVLIKDFQYFQNHTTSSAFNTKLFESAVTTIKDSHWKHVRCSLTPTFSSYKMRKMSPLINNCSQKLVNNVKKYADENKVMNLIDMFGGYSMDALASTLFGFDLNSQQNPDEPFVKNAKMLQDNNFRKTFLISVFLPFLPKLCRYFGIEILNLEHMKFFNDVVLKALNEKSTDEENASNFLDMISSLRVEEKDLDRETNGIKWSSKGLTTREITTQSMIFIIAGYQATLSALTFMAYNLAWNPDIQDKLIAEIDDKLQGGEVLGYDTIKGMNYLDMVFHESLRLYPPATRGDRFCSEDVEIDGVLFKKGCSVIFPISAIHSDPDFWPEPHKFDPERFSEKNKDKIHPLSWLPFGMGPRNCIGMRLAILEVKMAIVSILQNYKFVTCPDTEPHPVKLDTRGLMPKNPIKLKVESRF